MQRYSIKQLFLLIAAFALVSIVLGMASRGSRIGYGLSLAFVGTLIPFLVMAVLYWLAFAVGVRNGRVEERYQSPGYAPDRLENDG